MTKEFKKQHTDRIVRLPEATQLTGLSAMTIYRREKNGEFPKRRKISRKAVGWLLSEIYDWMGDLKN